jgi:hypothetical protein
LLVARSTKNGEKSTATSMRPPVTATIGLSLALLSGCGGAATEDFVLVSFTLPDGVGSYEGLRLAKFVDVVDEAAAPTAMRSTQTDGRSHVLAVGRPGSGSHVKVWVQAYSAPRPSEGPVAQRFLLAQGSAPVEANAESIPLKLGECMAGALYTETSFSKCTLKELLPEADGGVGSDAGPDGDGDADAGPGETTLGPPPDAGGRDGADAWTAPACQQPPADAQTPDIQPPAPVHEGCTDYCAAMERNCPSVYGTLDRCLYACNVVAWPWGGANEDGLRCRTMFAKEANRPVDCKYASPDSAGACGTPCEVYCRMGALVCPSHFPTQCRQDCSLAANRIKTPAISAGILCRMEFLQEAIFDPTFCSWAAPYNTCGAEMHGCLSLDFDKLQPPTPASFTPSPASPPAAPGSSFR